jgi:plasmid stabilization system protein ParE
VRVLVRPEASQELIEAAEWYEAQLPGLGLEFGRAFESAIAAAVRNPQAYAEIEQDCRRVILRKFPYSLVYFAEAEVLLVVAVFHHSREPRSFASRLGT